MIYKIKETGEEFEATKLWPSDSIIIDDFLRNEENIQKFKNRVGIKNNIDKFSDVIKISVLNINAIYTSGKELAQTLNSMNLSEYDEVMVLVKEDNNVYTFDLNPKVRVVYIDDVDIGDFADNGSLILNRPTDTQFALDKCRADLREARKEVDTMQEYEDLYKKWDESQCYPKIRG